MERPLSGTGLAALRKFVAPEFVFGSGARYLAARYVRHFGARRALVVSDPGVSAAGWLSDLLGHLGAEGLETATFTQVTPNPRSEEVMAGAECYRQKGCEVVIALGGGSAMDCAKGIAIVSSNRRPVRTFEGIDRVESPGAPMICIPTTAGTSADVSQFAIITDLAERRKFAIISKTVVPDIALIDPDTTATMSPYLAACTGMDALVHAIEAFVSQASSAFADLLALEAIRLIKDHLHNAVAGPDDTVARGQMMQASLLAGLAFSNTSLGAVHAMAHSVGGFFDLPHGECNAILLRHVLSFNFADAEDRYLKVGEALGLDMRGVPPGTARDLILDEVDRLRHAVGVADGLGRRGATTSDIRYLATNAMRDPCMVTNPRRPNQRDIEVIYEEAM